MVARRRSHCVTPTRAAATGVTVNSDDLLVSRSTLSPGLSFTVRSCVNGPGRVDVSHVLNPSLRDLAIN